MPQYKHGDRASVTPELREHPLGSKLSEHLLGSKLREHPLGSNALSSSRRVPRIPYLRCEGSRLGPRTRAI